MYCLSRKRYTHALLGSGYIISLGLRMSWDMHTVCHLEVNEALLVLHMCTVYITLYTFLSPIMLLGAWLPTALL